MNARQLLPRLLLLGGLAATIVWAAFNREQLDLEALDAWLSGLGFLVPLAYLGFYAVATIAFFPGALLTLAGGALFGPVWGSLLNLLGATMGASLAFLIARYLAGDWVAARTGGRLKRLIEGVEAEGWRFVAFVRLVPLFPFNLTNYAFGLTRVGFVPYVITSFICMAPGAIRLYLARPCRTRGACRRRLRAPLRPDGARPARGHRLPAATDQAIARRKAPVDRREHTRRSASRGQHHRRRRAWAGRI